MKQYDNVYILYVEDDEAGECVKGVFSCYDNAQSFADDNVEGWYRIEEHTLDLA